MKTLFSLALLAALTGPIYAVDGVVLINQSNALAGNVTPGDAPGFPISITVSGSYRLSSNLIVPDANTDGIDILADNVTIDLNGFSIIGPVVCSGRPVTSCSPQGNGNGIAADKVSTAVLNGDIHGMGARAIQVGVDSRIENVHVSQNGLGGISVSDGKISSCIVSFNRGDGIFVPIGGALISGNVVKGNGEFGIAAGCPSLMEDNTLISNANNAIVTFTSGCVLVNNTGQ